MMSAVAQTGHVSSIARSEGSGIDAESLASVAVPLVTQPSLAQSFTN
jgi:hypothetical protein